MWPARKKNPGFSKNQMLSHVVVPLRSPGGQCGADQKWLCKEELALDLDAQTHIYLVTTMCRAVW